MSDSLTKGTLFQILTILIFGNSLVAQNTFEKTFPVNINPEFTFISQMLVMPDSGYAFAQTAYNNGNNTLLIGRFDKSGNVIWIKQIDDNSTIYGGNLALSPDGYLYVTFSVFLNSLSRYFSIVLKFDTTGNLIWSKSFGELDVTQESEQIFASPSGIYIAGELRRISTRNDELYLLKIDANGVLQWGKTYDAGGIDYLRDAKQLRNGDILLSGWTENPRDNYYASLFRLDSNGQIIWNKRFHVPTYKMFSPQAVNENYIGDILVSGRLDTVDTGIGFGLWDIFLMKLSSAGDFKWGKIYGGEDYDESWSVAPTSDGGYIIGAEPESFGNVSRIGLLKTDSIGNVEWMRLYGKATGGFPNNVVVNNDKGYTILASDGNYNVSAPMVLIRTDSMGITVCTDTLVSIQTNSFQPIEESIGTEAALTGFAPFSPIIADYPLTAQNYCPFEPCPTLILSFTVAVAIPGLTKGAMRVFVSGGEPPYNYSLDSLTFQTSNTFKFLELGTYQVYVTDDNGCTGQGTFTIDETNCNCGRH